MTATLTFTGRVSVPGADIGKSGTLYAHPGTVDEILTLSDRLTAGPAEVKINDDGFVQDPGLQVPDVAGVLWTLVAVFEDRRLGRKGMVDLGTYDLHAESAAGHTTLRTLVVAEPTAITATDRAAIFQLIADLASFSGGVVDGTVTGLITNPSALRTALDARYDRISRQSVRGWGALGNGSADDTAAFTNSLAAAIVSPEKTWYIERGTYLLTSFPDVPSGMNVEAEEGATVKLTAAVTRFQDFNGKTKQVWKGLKVDLNGKPTSAGFRFGNGAYGLRFENVSVTSSAPMAASVHAVSCEDGCVNINWRGGRLSSLLNPARVFGNATRVWFRFVEIVGYGHRGIFVNANTTAGSEAGSKDCWITDCTIIDPGYFRTVTSKRVSGGTGYLTLAPSSVGEPTVPYVVGQVTDVRGVGAPFDGTNLTVTSVSATEVGFAVAGGDVSATAVTQTGNFPPAVQMAGDPRQPIAVQNGNYSGTVPAPGPNVEGRRHTGLRINDNNVKGIPGIAHHLTLTGDPEAGSLLGGTADGISVHGADSPMIERNTVEDSGEVGITIGNFTRLARAALNKLRRSNTNAIACQNVYASSLTDNEIVDSGADVGATAAPRTGAHTGIWIKDSPDTVARGNRFHDNLLGAGGTAIQTAAFILLGTNNAGSVIGANPLSGGTTVLAHALSAATGKTGVRWDMPWVEVEAAADQSTPASDTTLQTDNALALSLEPYGVYEIDGTSLAFNATVAGDAAMAWATTTTAGDTTALNTDATIDWTTDGPSVSATSAAVATITRTRLNKASTAPIGGGGANDVWVYPKGRVKLGATGGTLKPRFGQNAADATPAIRRSGSRLRVKRVG